MARMTAAALMLMFLAATVPAYAAGREAGATDAEDQGAAGMSALSGSDTPALVIAGSAAFTLWADDIDSTPPPVHFGEPRRGGLLPVLYVSLAGLNAYDAYSTTKGLSRGARESNPVMRGAAGSPAAIWAIKGGVTGASIMVAERLWRAHKRPQAIGVMIISNGLMAAVAARNASVLRGR